MLSSSLSPSLLSSSSSPPLSSSSRFTHFEGTDITIEAQAFCQQTFPSLNLSSCATRLVTGASEAHRSSLAKERQIVFAATVEINGKFRNVDVGEGEDGGTAARHFCENLARELSFDADVFGTCLREVAVKVETQIVSYMENLAAERAQPPLFELPVDVGGKVLPLAFTLSEHPLATAKRFCVDQWPYISTVLQSRDPAVPVSGELCVGTLFDLTVGVIDELLGSGEGLALAAEQRAFKLDVTLPPSPSDAAASQETIELNVFPGQTADVAVDNFLRRTGVGNDSRDQLVTAVTSMMRGGP